jgi:hypothetical protein
MVSGESAVSVGVGKLICCWQQVSATAETIINNSERRTRLPKLVTPESAGWTRPLKAIVETTRDGRNRQSGCLAAACGVRQLVYQRRLDRGDGATRRSPRIRGIF